MSSCNKTKLRILGFLMREVGTRDGRMFRGPEIERLDVGKMMTAGAKMRALRRLNEQFNLYRVVKRDKSQYALVANLIELNEIIESISRQRISTS